jgi:hypothetical protein
MSLRSDVRPRTPIVQRLHPEHAMRPRTPQELAEDVITAKLRLKSITQQQQQLSEEYTKLQRLLEEPSDALAHRLGIEGLAVTYAGQVLCSQVDVHNRTILVMRPLSYLTSNDPRLAPLQSMVDTLYPPDEPAVPHAATADVCASDAQAEAAAEGLMTSTTSHAEPVGRLEPVELQSLDTEAA